MEPGVPAAPGGHTGASAATTLSPVADLLNLVGKFGVVGSMLLGLSKLILDWLRRTDEDNEAKLRREKLELEIAMLKRNRTP